MVLGTRIELVQDYSRGILSPLRLPIPPPEHRAAILVILALLSTLNYKLSYLLTIF
jgi:hypothetical protein